MNHLKRVLYSDICTTGTVGCLDQARGVVTGAVCALRCQGSSLENAITLVKANAPDNFNIEIVPMQWRFIWIDA